MNPSSIRALNRLGDIMIPGDESFPKFSDTQCVRHIHRIVAHMPEGDRSDLNLLLTILSRFPLFALRIFISFLEKSPSVPDWLGGGLLRTIRLGLRGVVMSLYYGDEAILAKLDYRVGVSRR